VFDGAPYQRGSSDTRTSSLARTSLGILDDPHTPATALRKRASYRAMDRRDKLPHPRRGLWIPPAPHTVRVLPQVLIRSNMLTATFAPQFELHCTSFWERLLIPAFVFYFCKLYPFRQVNTPGHPIAAAAGGSMLVRLETLRQAGGLERIRGELIDDCAMARLLKSHGDIWLGLTLCSRSIRPYGFTQRLHTAEVFASLACRHSLRHGSRLSDARNRSHGRHALRQLSRRRARGSRLDPHVFSLPSHHPLLPAAGLDGIAVAGGCPPLYVDDRRLRQASLAGKGRRMERKDSID